MKPLVYYGIKEVDENTLSMNKALFDKILDEVYGAGFEDGRSCRAINMTYPTVTDRTRGIRDSNAAISIYSSQQGGAIGVTPSPQDGAIGTSTTLLHNK